MIRCLKYPDTSSKTKKTIALSFGNLTNTCLNAFLQMLLVRFLSQEELAIYLQSVVVYTTLFPFLQAGVDSGMYYLLVRSRGNDKGIITEGVFVTFLISCVVSCVLLFYGNEVIAKWFNNPQIIVSLYYLLPYLCVTVPESIVQVCFVFYNRINFMAYYNIAKTFIVACVLVFTAINTVHGYVLFAVRSIASSAFGLLTVFLVYRFILIDKSYKIHKKGFYNILSFSVPLSLSVIAGVLSTNLDKWLVSSMLTPREFAIYQMGAYELPFIGMITGAISMVMVVDINKAAEKHNFDNVIRIFREIAEKTSFILLPIMCFFLCASQNFILFMFTDKYIESVYIFCIYLLYIPIRCVIYAPVFVALGKAKFMVYREVASLLLNLCVSVYAIQLYGAIGAALATIIVTYIFSVPCNLYYLSKWSGIKAYRVLPFLHMIKCLIISIPGGCMSKICDNIVFVDQSYFVRFFCMFVIYVSITLSLYSVFYKERLFVVFSFFKGRARR